MPDSVLLDPALAPALAAAGLASVEGLLSLGGPPRAGSTVAAIDLPLEGSSGRFHLKRYVYPGWRQAKGLLGRGTIWGRAPEVNEFRALAWLRERNIPAVRPVAAASRRRRGRLVAHALLTEHVDGARDLAARLREVDDPVRRDPSLRRRVLCLVAHHLGRMHAEGFVHRDVHARNVLVRVDEDAHIWFLDCRRGGDASSRHGPLYDLATLDGDLEGVVPTADRLRALRAWLPEGQSKRRAHERIARLRRKIRRRDERKGRNRR